MKKVVQKTKVTKSIEDLKQFEIKATKEVKGGIVGVEDACP